MSLILFQISKLKEKGVIDDEVASPKDGTPTKVSDVRLKELRFEVSS